MARTRAAVARTRAVGAGGRQCTRGGAGGVAAGGKHRTGITPAPTSRADAAGDNGFYCGQGLTLVHFSAQLERIL
jgi:hypothetical protein